MVAHKVAAAEVVGCSARNRLRGDSVASAKLLRSCQRVLSHGRSTKRRAKPNAHGKLRRPKSVGCRNPHALTFQIARHPPVLFIEPKVRLARLITGLPSSR